MAGRARQDQQPVVHFGPKSRNVELVGPLSSSGMMQATSFSLSGLPSKRCTKKYFAKLDQLPPSRLFSFCTMKRSLHETESNDIKKNIGQFHSLLWTTHT